MADLSGGSLKALAVWGMIGGLLLAQLCRLVLFVVLSQFYLPLAYPAKKLACIVVVTGSMMALAQLSQSHEIRLLIAFSGGLTLLVLATVLRLIPVDGLRASLKFKGR